ncbi:hypothetical protein HNR65_000644 [Desulfosalsimonas propionicica]|uniref:Uncharacterized protein n=1 Tax=Desulfosalsimonas propionicica TaxID=332175 RepID=A0A7W0HJN0_9BACT|nr:hypothetical protein [Desulfosalsimonas propionicica]MBA2880337.1 hypothetical protein [Desulfosalsimonas propionicica]
MYIFPKYNGAVKSFLPRPLLLQEGSPAAGVSFFAPDRLRIQPMPSLKISKTRPVGLKQFEIF